LKDREVKGGGGSAVGNLDRAVGDRADRRVGRCVSLSSGLREPCVLHLSQCQASLSMAVSFACARAPVAFVTALTVRTCKKCGVSWKQRYIIVALLFDLCDGTFFR
jgi:hypothetical protein